jgi:hypothetical protein
LFCCQHFQIRQTNNPNKQINIWHSMTTVPRKIDLTLKWHHKRYNLLIPNYPKRYYLFKNKTVSFWDYFGATAYILATESVAKNSQRNRDFARDVADILQYHNRAAAFKLTHSWRNRNENSKLIQELTSF